MIFRRAITVETTDGFREWLGRNDVVGFALGGRAPNYPGPRRLTGIPAGGTYRERTRIKVPLHIYAAVRPDLVWMHEQGGEDLPKGVLLALRGKHGAARPASRLAGRTAA